MRRHTIDEIRQSAHVVAPAFADVEPVAVWDEPLSSEYGRMGATRVPFRSQPVTVVGDVRFEPSMVRVRTADGRVHRTLREYVTASPVDAPAPVALPTMPAGPDEAATAA